MTTIELLEKNPLTTKLIQDYYLEKLLESINTAEDVPNDFKDFLKEQPIDNKILTSFIDANPHGLVYVFDQQNIIIQVLYNVNKGFYYLLDEIASVSFKTRKEAERDAIEIAFNIVEEILNQQFIKNE